MSPLKIRTTTPAGDAYPSPILGPSHYLQTVRVDISGLTTDEVDENGWLKPGVPFTRAGLLVGAGDVVFGVTPEAVQVATSNASGVLAAAADCDVGVLVIGIVQREVAEDILGRVYTDDELAGFEAAGCLLSLTTIPPYGS